MVGLGQGSLAQIDGLPESERILPWQQETHFHRFGVIEFFFHCEGETYEKQKPFLQHKKSWHRRLFEY